MRQNGEYRMARRALDALNGHPAQTETDILRMARQASASAAGRLVLELKAEGQEEGEHEFDKGLAIAKQLKVGGFILEINSEGAVFASLASSVAHGASSGQMVGAT